MYLFVKFFEKDSELHKIYLPVLFKELQGPNALPVKIQIPISMKTMT